MTASASSAVIATLSCIALMIGPSASRASPFAYISNAGSNNVSVIDTASNTVVASIAVGGAPNAIGVNASGTRVYVANNSSNNISVIDTATNSVVATVPVGGNPYGVAVNPSGTHVYVGNFASNNVSVIATASNTVVATVTVGAGPYGVALNPSGTRAYVANYTSNNVTVIDTASNTVVATVPAGNSPNGIVVNPAGTRVYVTNGNGANVSVLDTASNTVVGTVAVGSSPYGIAVNSAGNRVYVANGASGTVSVIDASSNTVVGTVSVGNLPIGIGVVPGGTRVYVANFASNNVSVLDTASNNRVVATIGVGPGAAAFGLFIGGATSLATAGMREIAVGTSHALAVDATGKLRGWGDDSWGQVGIGKPVAAATPQRVVATGSFQRIASGGGHNLAVKLDGTLWGWGRNDKGQVGDGGITNQSTPVQIGSGFTAVAAGGDFWGAGHSLGLKSDGTVWSWGQNDHGQLGDGTSTARSNPVMVGTGFTTIVAGTSHSLGIKGDKTLWAWGLNNSGQLGDGTYSDRSVPVLIGTGYVSVKAGGHHTLAMKGDGTLWSWGQNTSGQLGDGSFTNRAAPMQIGSDFTVFAVGTDHSLALKANGSLWSWGRNEACQLGNFSTADSATPIQVGAPGFTAIAGGEYHSLAIKSDGTLWAFGYNDSGQLGDGTFSYRCVPVQASSGFSALSASLYQSLAIKLDGSLWAWGNAYYGALGDGTPVAWSTPQPIANGFFGVTARLWQSLAIKPDGTLWAWGWNDFGQLCDGTTAEASMPKQIGTGFAMASAGSYHNLAIKGDGGLWSCGDNFDGQLGDGTLNAHGSLTQIGGGYITAAAGDRHSLALKTDGTLYAWGNNGYGELGDGSFVRRLAPVAVGGGFSAISANGFHSLGVKSNGTLWAWGWNQHGQVGDGTTADRGAPVMIGSGFAAVAAGGRHSVAIKTDGTLWAWGNNANGQLGDGTQANRLVPVQVGAGFTSVVAGDDFTLAMKSDGTVWGWGRNNAGELGDGTYVLRPKMVVVVAEVGSGHLDANNWFLDLKPALAKSIPSDAVPKVLSPSRLYGVVGGAALDSTIKYKTSEFGKGVNNYVFGLVPLGFFDIAKSVPGAAAAAKRSVKADGLVLAQLIPGGWAAVQGQLDAYSQTIAGAAGELAKLLDGIPLGKLPPGTRFCVGYGESAHSMLSAQTAREILNIGTAATSGSGAQCVLSGVYLDGPRASRLGTEVEFSASIVGASPTGTVQFKDGSSNLLAPVVITASNEALSKAAIKTSSLALGLHPIGAAYSGDALNTWGPVTEVVPLLHEVSSPVGGSSVELDGPSSARFGTEIAFSVTVAGNNPTGSVQLKDGSSNLGAPAPLVLGVTTMRVSGLSVGSHSISAAYSGDGLNAGSVSNTLTLTVATNVTPVALSSSANPSVGGQPVTLTATVTGSSPAGSVVFRDESTALSAAAALANGVASITVAGFAPGLHRLSADYSGDANNPAGTSATLFQQVSVPQTLLGSTTSLSSSVSPSTLAQATTFTATVTGSGGTPSGTVAFRDGASLITGCQAVALVSGAAACTTNALASGTHVITATYSGSTTYETSTSIAVGQTIMSGSELLTASPGTLDFGGQSLNTTAPALVTTITNGSGSPVTITAVTAPLSFGVSSHNCTTLAPGAACQVSLTFTPIAQGAVAGLAAVSYAGGGPTVAALSGTGERSLVTHYYRSILRRAPDAPGKAFWESEATRLQNIGANINEAWFAMAQFFYFSAEYASFNRDANAFVTDLYNTFFNRSPDGPGLGFWTDLISSGMPREVILTSFMFSTEFASLTQAIFGNTAARAEVDMVFDFYRGLLARLPDATGFTDWRGSFRTAQCSANPAASVYTSVANISTGFIASAEYTNRNRTNSQYVGDLYNAALRRGGDLNGVQFWINQLNTAAMTREQVRQQFIASGEFNGRVTNIINQGCLP